MYESEGGLGSEALVDFSAFRDKYLQRLKPASRDKYRLGEALIGIEDDRNRFEWFRQVPYLKTDDERFQNAARVQQIQYEADLNREIKTIGLPQDIKNGLETIRESLVRSVDWGDGETFFRARYEWRRLKDLAVRMQKENPELKKSVTYYKWATTRIASAYRGTLGKPK